MQSDILVNAQPHGYSTVKYLPSHKGVGMGKELAKIKATLKITLEAFFCRVPRSVLC